MIIYEKLLRELYKNKVKYLVVGGWAVNLHGYDRITGDLDIILLLDDENLKKFLKVVNKLGLRPRLPVKADDFANAQLRREWIKHKNMKAFAFYDPQNDADRIDAVIDHPVNFQK